MNTANETKLTTAELMNLHTETLAEQRYERTLRNIQARAAVLLTTGGYSLNADGKPHFTGVNFVYGPKGQQYMVDTEFDTCDCAAFANYGTCKHLQAVKPLADAMKAEAEAEAALCAAHDAEEADADWYTDRLTFRPHFAEAA